MRGEFSHLLFIVREFSLLWAQFVCLVLLALHFFFIVVEIVDKRRGKRWGGEFGKKHVFLIFDEC